MTKSIVLKGRTVSYELVRKNVKNINLRIKADKSIFVSASPMVTEETVSEFILSKSDFILKALLYYEEIEKYIPKAKQFIDGETFNLLGHELRLKVIQGNKNYVNNEGAYIILCVKDASDFELKKRTMEKWQKKQCIEAVSAVCEAVYPKFQKYGVGFPELKFRNMVSRWGSCQPKRGILTFNTALVETPVSCIEYVVTHEFVHFLQPNHSKKFYQYLAMFMPDWMERKKALEKSYRHIDKV